LLPNQEFICFNGLQHQALALLFSFESLFKPACELIAQGFHKSQVLSKESVVFFDIHAVADADHASQLQEALAKIVTSSEEWEETLLSVRQGAKLLYEFFDSIASFYSQKQASPATE
jgi:pyrroloquinoline quinone (PQQ) biosynthesis protein C